MAETLSITNKTATLSSEFKGSKMRSADGEGKNGGNAGKFEPGRQYRLLRIKINEAFACKLARHPGLWQFLFNFGANKRIEGPASERIGKIRIREKFKGCRVELMWGIKNSIEVLNSRVSCIDVYVDGSDCYMDCTMQGIFPMSKLTLELEAHDGEVKCSIRFGAADEGEDEKPAGKQQDLVEEENEAKSKESPPTLNTVPAMGQAGAKH